MDLEVKPHPPPHAPAGAPAERLLVQPDRPSSTAKPPASCATSKKKEPKSKRKKLKAPDSDVEGRGDTQNREGADIVLIENPVMKFMCPKMSNTPQGPVTALIETSNKLEAVKDLMRTMKEAGIEPKHFDGNVLFDVKVAAIQDAMATQ
ncbi:Hypothetical protein PHPALM_12103 [Phytophthora palmivora]|uniref:Uncharacterized protein n=1 Tax=Phytophthora palmivora TaxID=4796 RepID=A0A2P4Y0T1_9STRA|nr:Hypothetical protein PHPALM_12103 [Phytophthora palmivora]